MVRHNRASLATVPELRTCGAFGDDAASAKWVQPSDLWQALLFHHLGSFTLNGHTFDLKPMDLVIVPPLSRCEVERWGQKEFVYNFAGFKPNPSDRDIVALPVKTNLEKSGDHWDREFRSALNQLQFSRTRAAVVVWNLLWSVALPEHMSTRSVYTEQAEKFIEDNLNRKLQLSDLCLELHISPSQLTKHFMNDIGRTPHQFILDRRAQLAHRLLTSTTIQIKQVATQCGMPNFQQFNRFIKGRYGESPRGLRMLRGSVDHFRVEDLERARGRSKKTDPHFE